MSDQSEGSAPAESQTIDSRLKPRRLRPAVLIVCAVVGVVIGAGAVVATQHFSGLRSYGGPPLRKWNDAPFITTPDDVVEKLLDVAEVKEGELLYDLGCGDGRIAIAAAKRGCRAKGYDIDADLIRQSRENAREAGVEDLVEFEQRDVFTLDLSDADVVAIYLLPQYLQRLMPQFDEMRPGTRIVAHDFFIEGVPHDKEIIFVSEESRREHNLYYWRTPLDTTNMKPLAPFIYE
ncbi:MAG: methyltransferase domain-containing protein [Planctomycetes bacterium]|nr:methyltransferase domain-containing protein [Planctomycetota bacterium]